MLQAGYGLCFYLWKSVAPVHLSALYPVPHPFPSDSPALWLSLFAAVGMTAAVVLARRRFPGLACAWFCYVVLLLPVLGLVNDAPHLVADRYSYLACLPWAALAAVGLRLLWTQSGVLQFRRLAEAATVVALATLGMLTHLQCGVWRTSVALWDQALKVDAANPAALNNRGIARAADHDGPGALRDFTEAIRLDPEFVEAIYNRGCILADSGDWDGAIRDESEAIRLSPDYGRAYRSRARARRARGDASGAEADLAKAEGIESSRGPTGHASEIEALNNEGNRLASAGDFNGAIDRYTRALQLGPGIPGVYNNRGNARASRGDHAGAVADYTEALRLEPAFAEAFANRGLSRVFLGDLRAARDDYSEALRLAPGDPDVLANRGGVRNELGDAAGALADFDAALAAAPPGWARTPVVRALIVRLRSR
jgi:tetratricopeptide (TPR) repeat protein